MDYLVLIDSVSAIPGDFVSELVPLRSVYMEKRAAESCMEMLCCAERDGVEIKVLSAYRSPEYQLQLWKRSVADYMSEGLGESEACALTERYLAKPYHSEHHTGLACDFCSPDWDDTQDDFHSTEQGRWLCANAADFGFILRYPRMKEHITGIAYEPWHYRFVGKEHSQTIKAQGLTLEEYIYYYKERN